MKKNTKKFKLRVKKKLKNETANISRQYITKYSDIKKYFRILNDAIFDGMLDAFNDIKIKNLRCKGEVVQYEWARKGTRVYHLHMLPKYKNKKEFLDTLAHEMIHLYQMNLKGDTGNHNALFYSFRPKLNYVGLDI